MNVGHSRREDMCAALEGRPPLGAVPVWELEFHAWDQVGCGRVTLGPAYIALTPAEQERVLYANAETMIAAAEELGFAALTVPGWYWEIAPGEPAYYWLPGEARFAQIRALREVGIEDLMLVAGSGGVMAMPGAGQYVAFAYRLYDAADEVEQQARDTLAHGLDAAARLLDAGVEALFTASDIADNRGPYFNPAQMDRFILPYLRRWCEGVRDMGSYAILHTDGDVSGYLDELAGSGLHALQAIDPVAGMDIRQVKAAVGDRLCLCGNVDCGLLLTGTEQEVYQATRDLLLDCKAGGGLVLGASNAVQSEVPMDNYRAMIRAWQDYGTYTS